MPSPFPGMNPYLEQADIWQDFHQCFLTEVRNRLAAQVGTHYIVRLEAKIYLHELGGDERGFVRRGDLRVSSRQPPGSGGGTDVLLAAPMQVRLPAVDEEISSSIEIRDRERRTLVTVLELLSPANKYSGPDREAFIAKRQLLLHGPASYVELDLLRGPRMPINELPKCDYCCLVRRAQDNRIAGLWPIQLREPLPTFPIPLLPSDPPVQLDLQDTLHTVYDAAHYENYLYLGTPDPPLPPSDEAWIRKLVPRP